MYLSLCRRPALLALAAIAVLLADATLLTRVERGEARP